MKNQPRERIVALTALPAAGVALYLLPESASAITQALLGLYFLGITLYAFYAFLKASLAHEFRRDILVAIAILAYPVTTIVLGLILSTTEWGLSRQSWVVTIGTLTAILLIVSIARGERDGFPSARDWNLTFKQGAFLFLAVVLMLASYFVARVGYDIQPVDGFTQFWLLPAGDDNSLLLEVGVRNAEQIIKTYDVQVFAGDVLLDEWNDIRLSVDETWHRVIGLPETGIDYPVTAYLLLTGQTTPYRTTTVWPETTIALTDSP